MRCKQTHKIIHIVTFDFVYFFEVRDRFSACYQTARRKLAESTATVLSLLSKRLSVECMNFVIIHVNVKTSNVPAYVLNL